jgi:hypothetical protein
MISFPSVLKGTLMLGMILCAMLGLDPSGSDPGAATPQVQHVVLAQLGPEHLARTIERRSADGLRLVAWGERFVEWSLAHPDLKEVIPFRQGLKFSNGGCALDVDGDGVDEVVVARGEGRPNLNPQLLWLQERPGQSTWTEHSVARLGEGPISPHDILPFSSRSPTGEVLKGVVLVLDRQRLVWFRVPQDPEKPWERYEIGKMPRRPQSGMVIGDVAGHGRPDVVCGMFWAECPADPTREPWVIRRFGHFDDNSWGGMAKLGLTDIDGDNKLDIVAAEAEIPDARLGYFQRDPEQPDGLWTFHPIDKGLYCPHSLVLADLDGDGRTDIVVGEMTAGGWSFPLNPKPRILAYMAQRGERFKRQTLVEGWGVHELGIAAGPRPGTWRIFAADEIQIQKFPDMKTHVSSWVIDLAGKERSGGR